MSQIDIKSIVENIYTTFEGELLNAISDDTKELVATAQTYLADAKASLTAIGVAALSPENPMSWQEVKLKLIEEGKIAVAAFLSIEQQLASDIQSFVNTIISTFEHLLTNALLQLQSSN